MASVYNLEPQPNAKVILKTTVGDLSIELFGKQAPFASRNFIQHCLDRYYDNVIFHRLVPGFIVQGGDPTGTGSGGISAINDGEPFQDEFHSRLKFNRRGLLGMANESAENSNGSQFFFTLAATPELQGKNTMFGRIEGDTIYNLMKMAEAELVEDTETPLYPTKITSAEVLVNPFEDMVARVKQVPKVKDDGGKKEVKKRKKPAATSKNVLSFGGDEDVDEEMAAPMLKKTKGNPKLVSSGIEKPEQTNNSAPLGATKEKKAEKARRRKTPSPSPESDSEKSPPKKISATTKATRDESTPPSSPEPENFTKMSSTLEKTNAEIAALKASMKRNIDIAPKQRERPKNALEAMIPASSTRGRKRGKLNDEKGALDIFKAFKQRLEDMPEAKNPAPVPRDETTDNHTSNPEPTTTEGAEDEEVDLCDLHFIANCQSCKSWSDQNAKPDVDSEMDGEDDAAWMSHQLSFAKDTLGKDLEWKRKMEEIEVIDPREKARSIKEERKKGREKGKKS